MWQPYFTTIPPRLSPLFDGSNTLWEPLDRLGDFIKENIEPGNKGMVKGDVYIEGDVEIGEGTVIEHGTVILGPTIIGKNCVIRAGAYVRGQVVTGDNCVIGHATEVVRSLLLDGVRVDHFNYIGDSILGNNVHFGAGAKVANLRFDELEIMIDKVKTGRKKLGVVLGDNSHLGVNVSIGPGMIVEAGTWFPSKDQMKSGLYNKDSVRSKR